MADEIAKIIVELAVLQIVRPYSYIFSFNSYIEKLVKALERLQAARDVVKLQVDAATARHNLESIHPAKRWWLETVDDIERKAFQVLEQRSNLGCPNVKQRYMLSREARKLIYDIENLVENLTYNSIRYASPLRGHPTRNAIVERVMEALEDDRITMIGICGIGGVGKTTMANEVCRRTIEQGLFEEFAMTSVFQGRDLLKIQKELGRMLGLYFVEEETILLRAKRLHERILSKGKKILVILDDVWQKLSLQEVGIPRECKVICISRNENVLRHHMGTHKIFAVEVLTEKESRDLFEAIARKSDGTTYPHADVKRLVKICGGLPIAITTLAKVLKNKEKHVWDNALQHLEEPTGLKIHGMDEHVFKCIELGYKFQKDGARILLLLCCLCPEDTNIWVKTLVRFKYLPTLEAVTEDEVRTLLGDLINSNLLIAGEDERGVKVHHDVREVCLRIEGLNKLGQNREGMVNRSLIPRKLTFYEEAESQAFKQVMDALANNRICTIGVLGMAGAEKRTLLNEVVEKVKENKLFDVIAMIKAEVVSEMQSDLAEMIGLVFNVDTERAKQLRVKLTDGIRRTLIIINYGVWNTEIDLEKVGIPVGAEHKNKCKVVIVSQDPRVWEIIGCEKIVKVEPMSREEALILFRKHAGNFDEELEHIAKQIVEKCEGQSWAIVILGEALKNQDENTWSNANDHLLKGRNNVWLDILDLLKGPYSSRWIIYAIEFSCRHLSTREAKILLLLICMVGDITIEMLVVMCVEKLKLFKDVKEGDL